MNIYFSTPRFIQRITPSEKKKGNPHNFGGGMRNGGLENSFANQIYKFASFDYMGAAEFEFGRLDSSIKNLLEYAKQGEMKLSQSKIDGKIVWIISHSQVINKVRGFLRTLAHSEKREFQLKEFSHFSRVLAGESLLVRGWIDIENSFMFFTDEALAQNFYNLLSRKAKS